MILYYTPNSPYARIARIGRREGGLTGKVEEHEAILRKPENPVLETSPLGRVPTLAEGRIGIADTSRIYARLAEVSGNAAMRPAPASDGAGMALEGLVIGMLEGFTVMVRESRRPEEIRMAGIFRLEGTRAERALTALEAEVTAGHVPAFPAFAAVTLAAALGFMEFYDLVPGWAGRFPRAAAWLAEVKRRPSMVETAPIPT